uniref:ELMO domain-containing protein n=1 Tax=Leersia perrieri TaxID=77586 RepID=A0A0D9W7S9_9ORYZ
MPARIAARRRHTHAAGGGRVENKAPKTAERQRHRGMDRSAGSFVAVRRLSGGASCHHPSPAEVVAGSTAWIGRGFSCVCAQRRDSDQRISFELSPAQEGCLQRLQNRIEVPYDSSNGEHQEALKALWRASFPGTELLGLVSDQWKDMGWQGKDPSTDFRGGGFISLENLLYFATNYTKSFQELLYKKIGDRALWEYPFAVAGVNITFMLIQMLDLQAENDRAFDVLYCITFKLMDHKWLEMHANYMDFNAVIKSTRRQLERELVLEDIQRIEDMPSYRFLDR